jgi:hypothetical protein
MDHRSFDRFVGLIGDAIPRRLLIAAGAATLLPALGGPESALACKKVGKKCDKNKDCCDGARCNGGKRGKCRCKSGRKECGSKCKNLDNDENHCGSCNTACPEGIPCSGGICCVPLTRAFQESAGSCASSDECCDGGTCCTFLDVGGPYSICIDLLTHQTACGATCETVVSCLNFQPDRQCVNGQCVEV